MTYNGHRSRAYWNVSLWIGNDEGLYNLARECVRRERNRHKAAQAFVEMVGAEKTPDGYAYSVDKVKSAMRGM